MKNYKHLTTVLVVLSLFHMQFGSMPALGDECYVIDTITRIGRMDGGCKCDEDYPEHSCNTTGYHYNISEYKVCLNATDPNDPKTFKDRKMEEVTFYITFDCEQEFKLTALGVCVAALITTGVLAGVCIFNPLACTAAVINSYYVGGLTIITQCWPCQIMRCVQPEHGGKAHKVITCDSRNWIKCDQG